MSHEVETMFSRTTPWHELGVVTGHNLTAREALVTSGLDWTVQKQPIYALTNAGFKQVEDKRATVRDLDDSVLGVVGKDYEPIQNSKMMDWAEKLLDTGEAQFVSAGSLRSGKIVFACLELGEDINLAGGDYRVKPYFIVASSHDASIAFKGFMSPTMVVCMNTLRAAMGNKISSWTIRHTSNADFRLDQARRLLGVVYKSFGEFQDEANRLLNTPLTESQFNAALENIIRMPKEPTDRQQDNVKHARRQIRTIYNSHTIRPFRSTAWGGLNAFNEYELWFRRIKGDRAERHALRTLNNDFPLTEKARKVLVGVNP